MSADDLDQTQRWRLLLGEAADATLGAPSSERVLGMDAALAWLYGRDRSLAERDVRERTGGLEASALSVPDWIDQVHRLFRSHEHRRSRSDPTLALAAGRGGGCHAGRTFERARARYGCRTCLALWARPQSRRARRARTHRRLGGLSPQRAGLDRSTASALPIS